MRTLILGFYTALSLASLPLSAATDTPSTASVETLIKVSGAEANVQAVYGQVEQMMRQVLQQQSAGKTLSDAQKKIIELAPARMATFLRTEMSMDAMRPEIINIYQETLSQAEVDSLITFYQSPGGRAFVEKMPVIMQRSMSMGQQRMQVLQPKMQAMMLDIQKEAGLTPAQ